MLPFLVGRCSFEGEISQKPRSKPLWEGAWWQWNTDIRPAAASTHWAPIWITALRLCRLLGTDEERPHFRITVHNRLVNVVYLLLQVINRTINKKLRLGAWAITSEHPQSPGPFPGWHIAKPTWVSFIHSFSCTNLFVQKLTHLSFCCAEKSFNLYPLFSDVRLTKALNAQTHHF